MKYIRTLKNIEKLMKYNRAAVETYNDEYSGQCADYKDDNYTIYTAIQDEDKMHVEIRTKNNGSATLYYELGYYGEWELIEDYITDIDDIVEVNKALRQTAKEIKAKEYLPVSMSNMIENVKAEAAETAQEENDERITEITDTCVDFVLDEENIGETVYHFSNGIYEIACINKGNVVFIHVTHNSYTIQYYIDGKDGYVKISFVRGKKVKVKMESNAGDDDAPADDTGVVEDTVNQMAEITDKSADNAQAVFNAFYDYIAQNTDKTFIIDDDNEFWIGINEDDETISACINREEKIVKVNYYEPRGHFSLKYDDKALSKISIDGSINPLEKAGPQKGPPPANEIY